MKTILFVLLILPMASFAQRINVQGKIEQTVRGAGYETALGFEFRSRIAAGVFYQTKSFREADALALKSDTYYGFYAHLPIVKERRLMLGAVLRGGLVNKNFFVVTPALETRFDVTEKFGVITGLAYRQGYPAGTLALSYSLPVKK